MKLLARGDVVAEGLRSATGVLQTTGARRRARKKA
jgi:hypothetical protein